ncbi:MAG: hypothetical protein WC966_03925 [Bradymonadales bacterium]|jgi:hypothetical protein
MQPRCLAIIGDCPKDVKRTVRVSSFSQFQRICGELESDSYLAGHAACHATMNGFDRVLFSKADIASLEAVLVSLRELVAQGSFDILVIPGLVDFEAQARVCDELSALEPQFYFRLLLDLPQDVGFEDAIERQSKAALWLKYVMPWVLTHSPGRRSEEWLPASAVAGALIARLRESLRGVHALADWSREDAAYLAEHGVAALYVFGQRAMVGLYPENVAKAPARANIAHVEASISMPVERIRPMNLADMATDELSALSEAEVEVELLSAIDKRCAEIMKQYPRNDKSLWQALRRSAEAVLRPAKEKATIKRYFVRCDEETASWGTPTSPVMEILLEFPKRVSQVQIKTRRI